MLHTLNVTVPAYVSIEIPDDTDKSERNSIAEELFGETPRDYVIEGENDTKGICDPKDAEISL